MSKHKSLEVINGELLVFGEKLPRHPEFPWLFSATHLHKFCGPTLRKIAEREGKDPDKVFAARRPGEWLKKNILAESQAERVAAFAKYTRRRIKKYGPNLGFRDIGNLDATTVASMIRGLSDLAMICVTLKGGSGANNLQGTYVAQHVITKYVSTFSPYFEARVHEMFISVLNGEVETVVPEVEDNRNKAAKGTATRKENAELMKDLDKACWTKNLGTHAQVLNGIHHGVLGKSGAKYLKETQQSQPLNDKLPVKTLATKNIAIIMSTVAIQEDKREELTGAQGKSIGMRCGSYAKFISENAEVKAMFEAHFEQEKRKARNR